MEYTIKIQYNPGTGLYRVIEDYPSIGGLTELDTFDCLEDAERYRDDVRRSQS